jgi:hypothetical protein
LLSRSPSRFIIVQTASTPLCRPSELVVHPGCAPSIIRVVIGLTGIFKTVQISPSAGSRTAIHHMNAGTGIFRDWAKPAPGLKGEFLVNFLQERFMSFLIRSGFSPNTIPTIALCAAADQ